MKNLNDIFKWLINRKTTFHPFQLMRNFESGSVESNLLNNAAQTFEKSKYWSFKRLNYKHFSLFQSQSTIQSLHFESFLKSIWFFFININLDFSRLASSTFQKKAFNSGVYLTLFFSDCTQKLSKANNSIQISFPSSTPLKNRARKISAESLSFGERKWKKERKPSPRRVKTTEFLSSAQRQRLDRRSNRRIVVVFFTLLQSFRGFIYRLTVIN